MASHHLVDPDLKDLLSAFPPLELSSNGLPALRATMAATVPEPVWGSSDKGVHVEELHIAYNGNPLPVRLVVYSPIASVGPDPAILHIHGGGFVLGSADGSDIDNRRLAKTLGCVIVSVDYRLAPETPFPGAIEDCFAALVWLHASADRLGVDPKRIGVKGESAGGGLAAALSLLARDRGGPSLVFQHLIYPMLDDRTCREQSPNPYIGEFIWTPADNAFGWSSLLGHAPGTTDVSPYAAPARATDLSNLPPTFIAVGGLDLFLEEDIEYAQRLARAGIPTELHVYPGAFHGFQLATEAAVTRVANQDSLRALRRAIGQTN